MDGRKRSWWGTLLHARCPVIELTSRPKRSKPAQNAAMTACRGCKLRPVHPCAFVLATPQDDTVVSAWAGAGPLELLESERSDEKDESLISLQHGKIEYLDGAALAVRGSAPLFWACSDNESQCSTEDTELDVYMLNIHVNAYEAASQRGAPAYYAQSAETEWIDDSREYSEDGTNQRTSTPCPRTQGIHEELQALPADSYQPMKIQFCLQHQEEEEEEEEEPGDSPASTVCCLSVFNVFFASMSGVFNSAARVASETVISFSGL
jgi:hypothetical protein